MLATLKLEWIGKRTGAGTYGGISSKPRPWCCQIINHGCGIERQFLHGQYDWTKCNSVESRGGRLFFILETGKLYEYYTHVSWGRSKRSFCIVQGDGEIKDLCKEEADKWLKEDSEYPY